MRIDRKVLRAVRVMFFQQQKLNLLLDLFFCFVPYTPRDEEMLWLRQVSGCSHQDKGDKLTVVLFLIPFECVTQLS